MARKKQQNFNNQTKKSIVAVSETRFEEILEEFYVFAQRHGFYTTISDTKRNDGYFVFAWQHDIIRWVLQSVFRQESMDITISVLRQVGKTEIVALVVSFIFETFHREFGVPVAIAVFAPVKRTAGILFKRTTQYISRASISADNDSKEMKGSSRGDTIQLFGIYDETKGSTIEGNTFDMIIRDEAHLGNDRKFVDETEPTRFSKRAPLIRIGNGGGSDCDFYRAILKGNHYDHVYKFRNVLVRYTYEEVKPYLMQLAEKGLDAASTRISAIESYIRQHGKESYEVQKNLYCRWMLEYGNVVLKEQVEKCYVPYTKMEKETNIFVGLDFATMYDRTVATLMDQQKNILDFIILKDKNVVMRIREQIEYMKKVCDDMGYTDKVVAIGFDSTGVGSGGVEELLSDYFSCDLIPHRFTAASKMEWYKTAIESITTEYEQDRVKIPAMHPGTKIFLQEWTSLERQINEETGNVTFNAPKSKKCFDDFVASYAVCLNVRNTYLPHFDVQIVQREEKQHIYMSGFSPYTGYSTNRQSSFALAY